MSATVINAYVGPALSRYLTRLGERLRAAGYAGPVLIMQSHGGVVPIGDAVRIAAGAVLSGPAGGVAGSRYCAQLLGEGNLAGQGIQASTDWHYYRFYRDRYAVNLIDYDFLARCCRRSPLSSVRCLASLCIASVPPFRAA